MSITFTPSYSWSLFPAGYGSGYCAGGPAMDYGDFEPGSIPVPAWRRYVKSAVLWVACVMACAWAVEKILSTHVLDVVAPFVTVVAGAGLLLIAPISVVFPAGPSASLGKRIRTYSFRSLP